MAQGKFITFEGPEGGGKGTQIRELKRKIECQGYNVIQPREPGSTPTGELIREILKYGKSGEPLTFRCETLLFEAARAQLIDNIITPSLEKGIYVLCDRLYDSTTAYQGYGREAGVETIKQLNMFATAGLKPDITFLLDLPVEEGMKRKKAQNEEPGKIDTFESLALQFHNRVRKGYLEIAASEPERVKIIDAMQSPEKVAEDIWNAYLGKFHPK